MPLHISRRTVAVRVWFKVTSKRETMVLFSFPTKRRSVMYKIIVPVVFGLFQVLQANKPSPELCVIAKQNCGDDPLMCGIAYALFENACDLKPKSMSTRSNQNGTYFVPPAPKPCSQECVESIERLKRTKRGKELYDCDCRLDGYCLVVKARVAKCLNKTKQEPFISCSVALWNCSRDPLCNFLKTKFVEDCGEMLNGVRCEKKCLKIQSRLFKSTYGKALAKCECDGYGEAYCRAVKGHAEQLGCTLGGTGTGSPAFTYVPSDPHIYDTPIPKGNTVRFPASLWTFSAAMASTLFLL